MTTSTKPTSWQDRGTCRTEGHPTSLWFPTTGGDGGAAGKAICARCPVRTACLDYATTAIVGGTGNNSGPQQGSPVHGIWGGVAFDERQPRSRRDRPTGQVRRTAKEQAA